MITVLLLQFNIYRPRDDDEVLAVRGGLAELFKGLIVEMRKALFFICTEIRRFAALRAGEFLSSTPI